MLDMPLDLIIPCSCICSTNSTGTSDVPRSPPESPDSVEEAIGSHTKYCERQCQLIANDQGKDAQPYCNHGYHCIMKTCSAPSGIFDWLLNAKSYRLDNLQSFAEIPYIASEFCMHT